MNVYNANAEFGYPRYLNKLVLYLTVFFIVINFTASKSATFIINV